MNNNNYGQIQVNKLQAGKFIIEYTEHVNVNFNATINNRIVDG